MHRIAIPHNRRAKLQSLICLLILAGSILLVAFHYHEGGMILDECPVCRFQDGGVAATSIDIAAPDMPMMMAHQTIICEQEILFTTFQRPFETLPNAPPSLS